jgi:hypothetical protein
MPAQSNPQADCAITEHKRQQTEAAGKLSASTRLPAISSGAQSIRGNSRVSDSNNTRNYGRTPADARQRKKGICTYSLMS